MLNKTFAMVAFLLLTSPAWAQKKQDKVTRKDGKEYLGRIAEDSFKQVRIGSTTIKAAEIENVEYYDAPPSFKGALDAIQEEKWADALSGLKSAHKRVVVEKRPRQKWKCRSWFLPYYHFYTGLCERNLGRFDAALKTFEKVRAKNSEPSRFWGDSFELSLECLREKGDMAGMDKLIKSIATAPGSLKSNLKLRGQKQQAELYIDKDNFQKALSLFKKIQSTSDTTIRGEAQAGVIRCLVKLKRTSELEQYSRQIISQTNSSIGLKLMASNALGYSKKKSKDYRAATRHFVESVVLYAPSRTSGYRQEHEDALYQLGSCYSELAEEASETKTKKYYLGAAAKSYRELATTYPSGRKRDEASTLADRLEAKSSKLK